MDTNLPNDVETRRTYTVAIVGSESGTYLQVRLTVDEARAVDAVAEMSQRKQAELGEHAPYLAIAKGSLDELPEHWP